MGVVTLVFVVIGTILGGTVAQPFLAGVLALLYVDRRMRAEGLDLVLQQDARRARRASGNPARGHFPATASALSGAPRISAPPGRMP